MSRPTRKGLIFLCATAWLIMDIKVKAYRNGCSEGYCFTISDKYSNELLDQSNAQQRCRSNGSQLVEIGNNDIQNSLANFIRSVYGDELNGWNVLTNGKRSSGNWKRLSGNGIGDTTVFDQKDLSYSYGYLKSTTSGFDLFASRPADIKEGFICTGLSDCSGGVTTTGRCYKSFTETLSWYDARNRCLDAGGDLASFDQITTNAGFNALNGSWISTSNSYWIGIRRESWIWQNTSSDVKYSDWMSGHPINDVARANSDCLCLWTTNNYWKWIECGCTQWLPFVCISVTPTTTTIRRSPPASWSTATYSAIVSESNGVSLPTDTTMLTLKSTGNDTGGGGAVIGIGVGVGVGGALIVIALIAAVIILCRKRCPFRCPERKKTNAKPQPPDILMQDRNESPYAQVVSSASPELNHTDPTIVYSSDSQTHTVYAPIGFCTEPQLQHGGNVTIVSGKSEPSPVSIPPKNNAATNHFKVGGDLYAEVTKA